MAQLENEQSNANEIKENNDIPIKKKQHSAIFLKYRGFLLVMVSALFMAIQNIFLRKANFFNAIEQTTVRYFFQLILLSFISCYNKVSLLGNKEFRLQMLFRGVLGTFGLTFYNISIKLINPSDTVTLFFSNVIIISIMARIFLKEKFSVASVFALILIIIGVLLISKPSFITPNTSKLVNINMTFFNNSNITLQDSDNSKFFYILGVSSALLAAWFA
jgi:drug/metabolite transporter (DMT)-like permease